MQHYAAFHLGLHCLPKYQLRGFQYTKGPYLSVFCNELKRVIRQQVCSLFNLLKSMFQDCYEEAGVLRVPVVRQFQESANIERMFSSRAHTKATHARDK